MGGSTLGDGVATNNMGKVFSTTPTALHFEVFGILGRLFMRAEKNLQVRSTSVSLLKVEKK
jgi:hypothetical protein